jgi:hypothetical protein
VKKKEEEEARSIISTASEFWANRNRRCCLLFSYAIYKSAFVGDLLGL